MLPDSTEQAEQQLLAAVTCPLGSSITNYAPPLKNTPQTVKVTGLATLSNCVSLVGPTVTSAEAPIDIVRPGYSCTNLLEFGASRLLIRWNTGETSTVVQTRVATQLNGNLVLLTQFGSVESGKFQGATVLRTTTYLNTDLVACSSPAGLPRLSGPTTLKVLSLR
ncbi:hypothetical protein [Myxococcus fulvus]|uniref:hypothetical protein n=1 Tax=Myxococcus fulvus TaxID=33 RepID=UPI001160C46F|nr:hypothetical protein [Myxococcus fulvus]